MQACRTYNLTSADPLQLERHISRCPIGDARHRQHVGLAQILVLSIFTDCGAKDSDILWELLGLRALRAGCAMRPCDVGWSDFYGPGRHVLCDGSVVSVFVNNLAADASSKPSTAAHMKEDEKLRSDAASAAP